MLCAYRRSNKYQFYLVWPDQGSNPRSTLLKFSTLTIIILHLDKYSCLPWKIQTFLKNSRLHFLLMQSNSLFLKEDPKNLLKVFLLISLLIKWSRPILLKTNFKVSRLKLLARTNSLALNTTINRMKIFLVIVRYGNRVLIMTPNPFNTSYLNVRHTKI
jgi:hypothetical protein